MRYLLLILLALLAHPAVAVAADPAPDAVIVGDSLATGTAPFLPGYRAKVFPGSTSTWAIESLREVLRPETRTILFDSGTNDTSLHQLRASLRTLLHLAEDRRVLIPTVVGRRKNVLIRRLDVGNVHVVRWRGYALRHHLLDPDRIHAADASAYRARARLILAS